MSDADGWWGTCQVPEEPVPVWVDLKKVFPPAQVTSGHVPLRVRASGIDNGQVIPAQLLSWHQTMTGEWWACVDGVLSNRAQRASIGVRQLVPADAVTVRE